MNKSEIAKQLLGFMRAHKNQFVLSILLAILGVASGMIPYFAIARIMLYLLEGIREMSIYAFWCRSLQRARQPATITVAVILAVRQHHPLRQQVEADLQTVL